MIASSRAVLAEEPRREGQTIGRTNSPNCCNQQVIAFKQKIQVISYYRQTSNSQSDIPPIQPSSLVNVVQPRELTRIKGLRCVRQCLQKTPASGATRDDDKSVVRHSEESAGMLAGDLTPPFHDEESQFTAKVHYPAAEPLAGSGLAPNVQERYHIATRRCWPPFLPTASTEPHPTQDS